ncbi:MAG: hypothetical protein IKQ04_02765 [Oscillospiraceae bacterium]|nr:hypothetical protein [Oscillospiraceae bacterium]
MKIACIGDNCIDSYDETGKYYPGGNAVNVAVYLHRMGVESSYVGAVGRLTRKMPSGSRISSSTILFPGALSLRQISVNFGI